MMFQIWHFGYSHFLLPVDATVYGKFDFIRMLPKFRSCLYAQIAVTSNGCLDNVNLLYFLNSSIIALSILTMERW